MTATRLSLQGLHRGRGTLRTTEAALCAMCMCIVLVPDDAAPAHPGPSLGTYVTFEMDGCGALGSGHTAVVDRRGGARGRGEGRGGGGSEMYGAAWGLLECLV